MIEKLEKQNNDSNKINGYAHMNSPLPLGT